MQCAGNAKAAALKRMLEPRSVAVVGASSKKGKIGYEILRNIVEGQFLGSVYPINPHENLILGLKVCSSIREVADVVDTCIVTVPPAKVPQVLEECGDKNVKGVVVISAGFSEIGNSDLEKHVLESASKHGVRVIGPNCAGIINTEKMLYATIESRIAPGSIAFITQSGALGGAALAWARQEHIGFSKFVSYGNRCDVDEADLLDYLMKDQQTKVIAMYIEGLRDGKRFLETAKQASLRKPILTIKSGCSGEGKRATLSHTGAMAGSDKVYDGAFHQAGIIRAEDIEDLFDMAKALSAQPHSRGDRILIVTNSGGPGVMMVDALVKLGLKVPEPSIEFKNKLEFLPEICSRNNPIDLTAQADPEHYEKVLRIAESDSFDAIVAQFIPPAYVKSEPISEVVLRASRTLSKPIVACWMSGDLVSEGVKILERRGVPNFPTPERAAKAIWALVQRGKYHEQLQGATSRDSHRIMR
jgi:acetyl coenzyme A synthetase (ADP forming)-like protein